MRDLDTHLNHDGRIVIPDDSVSLHGFYRHTAHTSTALKALIQVGVDDAVLVVLHTSSGEVDGIIVIQFQVNPTANGDWGDSGQVRKAGGQIRTCPTHNYSSKLSSRDSSGPTRPHLALG